MASAAMVMPAASVARTGTSPTRTLRGSAGALSSANAMRSFGLLRRAFAASFATIGSMITADSLNTAMVQHDTMERPSGIVKRQGGLMRSRLAPATHVGDRVRAWRGWDV